MGWIADIIKEIPVAANLEQKLMDADKKVTALEAENERLKRENRELKEQLERVIGPEQIEKDEERVLQVFGEYNASAALPDISQKCELSEIKAQYFIDSLKKRGLLNAETVFMGMARSYVISHIGRKYLITRGLVD